jgi:hypothetical protein
MDAMKLPCAVDEITSKFAKFAASNMGDEEMTLIEYYRQSIRMMSALKWLNE